MYGNELIAVPLCGWPLVRRIPKLISTDSRGISVQPILDFRRAAVCPVMAINGPSKLL